MFIYLIIASELAILYTVFWYLYLREPKRTKKIGGTTWGSYSEQHATVLGAGDADRERRGYLSAESSRHQIRAFMLPPGSRSEYVLDLRSNRYVPVPETEPQSKFLKLMQTIDQGLSHLNVRSR